MLKSISKVKFCYSKMKKPWGALASYFRSCILGPLKEKITV